MFKRLALHVVRSLSGAFLLYLAAVGLGMCLASSEYRPLECPSFLNNPWLIGMMAAGAIFFTWTFLPKEQVVSAAEKYINFFAPLLVVPPAAWHTGPWLVWCGDKAGPATSWAIVGLAVLAALPGLLFWGTTKILTRLREKFSPLQDELSKIGPVYAGLHSLPTVSLATAQPYEGRAILAGAQTELDAVKQQFLQSIACDDFRHAGEALERGRRVVTHAVCLLAAEQPGAKSDAFYSAWLKQTIAALDHAG